MIYKNLSIAAGGGIIAHNQQAEQEECANVFIGLGGTGISCLKEVKKQVFNRLQPDDPTSEIPEYKHIQFLAVDTDSSSLGDDYTISTLDTVTEFVDMSCRDIRGVLSNPRVLRGNPSLQWFGENITIHVVATSTRETEVRIKSASRIFLNFINGGANKKNAQHPELRQPRSQAQGQDQQRQKRS